MHWGSICISLMTIDVQPFLIYLLTTVSRKGGVPKAEMGGRGILGGTWGLGQGAASVVLGRPPHPVLYVEHSPLRQHN